MMISIHSTFGSTDLKYIKMKNLSEKVAVVTGSSKGVGAAIAFKIAAAEVVAQIKSNGIEAFAIKANVAKKEEISRLFDKSIAHFGKVDIWVNNAGVMLNNFIKDFSDEQLENKLRNFLPKPSGVNNLSVLIGLKIMDWIFTEAFTVTRGVILEPISNSI
ncbi:SDR family NAD(P)-dependent oxidoreductase [Xanthocytophaga agilis]|uniref:SDR family NAD(P)-dependent oxidoreductase n=1 Tax=Xanthocytophaga agilis TaxID=3048010 RepID=A0AAE3R9J3_9BACT|nr:SDR family NAD(P)-dependent oxidoreductase [Xanthocytophaga agilis]MDJ1505745.1 SDR family NAD(P)-dependent oxidoreductase [Xanthocytophaga agilis]